MIPVEEEAVDGSTLTRMLNRGARRRRLAQPAPRPARPAAPVVAAPRARARAPRRRRAGAARAKASASDGPPGPQVFVHLPPVDAVAVGRLARLLVERAAVEVCNRLGVQNNGAPPAATDGAPEEKVR